MKNLLFGMIVLAFIVAAPIQAMSEVGISVSIGLPPLTFAEPPDVVVLPETDDVYAVPDIDIDLFFWNGWWWRPWQGRWYRSRYYDRGWFRYGSVPRFYFDVDPGWRAHYRERNWYGYPWYYERIANRRLQRQWHRWRANRHWQRELTWGVWKYRPRPHNQRQELRRQRERQYRERSDVRQYQRERRQYQRQQQKRPRVQQPGQQHRERVRQRQRQPQVQGKPE